MGLRNPLRTLSPPIRICKICFKKVENFGLFELFHQDFCLCEECRERFTPRFYKFLTCGHETLCIYDYDENIKKLLYQLKGCCDYELANVFLEKYKKYLFLRYRGYILVPAPSYEEDDNNRGFNHVEEIFKCLRLPFMKIISKRMHYKQSDHRFKNREDVKWILELNKDKQMYGKKLLIVDDVYTSGSTVKTMVKLLEKLHPKEIKLLILSKTSKR